MTKKLNKICAHYNHHKANEQKEMYKDMEKVNLNGIPATQDK